MKTKETTSEASLHPEAINELAEANQNIHKKNRKAATFDSLLEAKRERSRKEAAIRPLLFHTGMAISILMVVIAMNWKVYDDGELVDLGIVEADLSEIIEIPISEQPPPPPPKTEAFKIAEVENTEVVEELELNLDVDVTANEVVEEVVFAEPEEVKEEVDEIFMVVEEQPTPVGGIEAFYTYLSEELRYPAAATRLGVSGIVFVQFVIEKDGSITQVELAKGIGAGCDEEAVRVIENAPNWNPGKQRGQPVRVRKVIPVRFVLKKK